MTDRRKNIINKFSEYFSSFNKVILIIIAFLLLFALYSRFSNLFNLGFEFDTVQTQYTWAKNALDLGYGPFWRDYQGNIDYLPGALFLGMSFAWIGNILDPFLPGDKAQAFVAVMKFFNTFVDLGIAITCYYVARNYGKASKERSALIATLCFAMPSFWFISNVWGQFDSLVVFLAVLSILLIYYRNKTGGNQVWYKDLALWSGILFGLGFWLKPLILMIVPLLLIYHFTSKPAVIVKSAILTTLLWLLGGSGFMLVIVYFYYNSSNSTPVILFLLFVYFAAITFFTVTIARKPFNYLTSLYRQGLGFWLISWIIAAIPVFYNAQRVGQMLALPITKENVVSAGASTFWPLIGVEGDAGRKLIEISGFGTSVGAAGALIFLTIMILIYLRYQGLKAKDLDPRKYSLNTFIERLFQRKLSFANFAILMTILGSTYFLFLTKIHSRYLIWSIVFSFIALAAIANRRGWRTWLVLLLVMHFGYFLNQLGVFNAWYQYLPWTISFMNIFGFDPGKLSSFCIFIGFLGFYLWTWRYSNPNSSLIEHVIN